jgi:hypothetical protein
MPVMVFAEPPALLETKRSLMELAMLSSAHAILDSIENRPVQQLSVSGKSAEAFIDMECGIIVAVAERILAHLLEVEPDNKTSLFEISDWLHFLLNKAQCTPGVVIVAYIYCERVLHYNKLVNITKDNWKSILLVSVLLASKVWDDLSMQNADFAYFTPFSLFQINDWERAFLRGLRYDVRVDPELYERLFHELRARVGSAESIIECQKRVSISIVHPNRPRTNSESSISTSSPGTSVSTLSGSPESLRV